MEFALRVAPGHTGRMATSFPYLGGHGGRLDELLGFLYGKRAAEAVRLVARAIERSLPSLEAIRESSAMREGSACREGGSFSERDALLISYGDMIAAPGRAEGPPEGSPSGGEPALARLGGFIDRRLPGAFSYLHILPFYPYSSDDGFSVKDYRRVDPALGSWDDIEALGRGRRLAFDLVLNHASAQGDWFRDFKAGKAPYDRFFVTRPLDYDSGSVLRPRTHPLVTPVALGSGTTAGVWTTFSADQVDLDFSEPAVLAEFVDIVLFYARMGARLLRLDAIAYLWKRDGTSCAHLPETHAVVKALRAVVEGLGLGVVLLTETNVPHEENMSYFGDGDEAGMVYNFSLPPLTLYAFATGDAGPLASWARCLRVPEGGTMLNFLASHDGIGVTPARGLVPDFSPAIEAVEARGGLVSMKATPEGPVPYELNVSWADAVSEPGAPPWEKAAALVASYAVAATMDGVPAVYFHSVVGSTNWLEGPRRLGYNRAINRERPRLDELEAALDDPHSLRARAMSGMAALLRARAERPAFSPEAPRRALDVHGSVFAVERGRGDEAVIAFVNCSRREARTIVPEAFRGALVYDPVSARRLGQALEPELRLEGYAVRWLERSPLGAPQG